MKRVGGILVLTALMVSLSACVWNLRDETQLGSLTVSISGGDGVGTLDFQDFSIVSFVVMEADQFRLANLSNVEFPVRPFGYGIESARETFVLQFDPTPLADVAFQPFELDDAGDYPQEGVPSVFPRGRTLTYGPIQHDGGIPGAVSFADLVVGKEYVVWIDGERGFEPSEELFGFAFVRIRSGAPTTVSIDLSDDRFDSFVESLYGRYIEPRVPRLDLAQFSAILYSGTGGATVAVVDTEGVPIGTEEQEYSNAVVFRLADPEYGFTVFFIGFFTEDSGEEDFASLSVVLIESSGALEPARSVYAAPDFSYDEETFDFSVDPGTVVAVEGSLESLLADFGLDFYDPETPIVISQMGFSGGAPSRGGTFSAAVSGPGFLEGEISDFVDISISNMSFTFGEVIDVFDDFDFDFDDGSIGIGDIGPAGGYIFYLAQPEDEVDWDYLEAAPAGWWFGAPEDPQLQWSGAGNAVPGTERALGAGINNTNLLIADPSMTAALEAVSYGTRSDFDDWFLPSLDELILMFENLHVEGLGGFTDGGYWSSWDQFDGALATGYQFMGEGNEISSNKTNNSSVRPIRAGSF